jgi:hypothetical protein
MELRATPIATSSLLLSKHIKEKRKYMLKAPRGTLSFKCIMYNHKNLLKRDNLGPRAVQCIKPNTLPYPKLPSPRPLHKGPHKATAL